MTDSEIARIFIQTVLDHLDSLRSDFEAKYPNNSAVITYVADEFRENMQTWEDDCLDDCIDSGYHLE